MQSNSELFNNAVACKCFFLSPLGLLLTDQGLKEYMVFLLGAGAGIVIAGIVYAAFATVVSPFADALVSGVTLMGFGLAIGGYLMRWRGDKSRELYFLMGVGIGILVVAFLTAGASVSPYFPN
jgi:hypothetical protein